MDSVDSWACDTAETRQLREQMVAALVQAGDMTDERWRHAFTAVPRHALAPRYYRSDNYQEIDATNAIDHSMWLRSVYSDETLTTQKTSRTVTSSGTMPGLVALLLHTLHLRDHHRVLQVGTGTGYTAGLLCERVGSHQVTTIGFDELPPHRRHRRRCPRVPTQRALRSISGYLCAAPYPVTWLAQAASGARIVAPPRDGVDRP